MDKYILVLQRGTCQDLFHLCLLFCISCFIFEACVHSCHMLVCFLCFSTSVITWFGSPVYLIPPHICQIVFFPSCTSSLAFLVWLLLSQGLLMPTVISSFEDVTISMSVILNTWASSVQQLLAHMDTRHFSWFAQGAMRSLFLFQHVTELGWMWCCPDTHFNSTSLFILTSLWDALFVHYFRFIGKFIIVVCGKLSQIYTAVSLLWLQPLTIEEPLAPVTPIPPALRSLRSLTCGWLQT